MTRRRGRGRGPARCQWCRRPVAFFTSPFNPSRYRVFEPAPVDGRKHLGTPAFPVENRRTAWRFKDLVEDLRIRHDLSTADAEKEAYDMEWYLLHACPNRPATLHEPDDTDDHQVVRR